MVNCFLYDTCGQEKYKAINESYYKKAEAVLLVYDISQKDSFQEIKDYYCPKIKDFFKKNIPIILLGNKADLEDKREVKNEEGMKLALQEKYKFKETSCLKNENVADAFEALIEMWNIEVLKKNIIKKERRPSMIKKDKINIFKEHNKKEMYNKSKTMKIKSFEDFFEDKDYKNVSLKKNKHSKKKIKKNCC